MQFFLTMLHCIKSCLIVFLSNAILAAPQTYNSTESQLVNHAAWEYISDNCGTARSPSRIVGGNVAYLGQFPWVVRVGYVTRKNTSNFLCGGTLINEWFVLTAAHCTVDTDRRYVVRLGENWVHTRKDCEGDLCAPDHQDIFAIKNIIHDEYSDDILINDIALLKLEDKALLNDFVQPICLPQKQLLSPNFRPKGNATVIGWGLTSSKRRLTSDTLLYVSVPFVPLEECSMLFFDGEGSQSQLCVGHGSGQDSCDGDSGGPLMGSYRIEPVKLRRVFLLGITSHGPEICGTGPAVYTNVQYYMDWILNNIQMNM